MNRERVAALLRELADEIASDVPVEAPSRPRAVKPRAVPKAQAFREPVGGAEVSDTDRMRAQHMLRRRGMR